MGLREERVWGRNRKGEEKRRYTQTISFDEGTSKPLVFPWRCLPHMRRKMQSSDENI